MNDAWKAVLTVIVLLVAMMIDSRCDSEYQTKYGFGTERNNEMGVCLTSKKSDYSFDMGYIGFKNLRRYKNDIIARRCRSALPDWIL